MSKQRIYIEELEPIKADEQRSKCIACNHLDCSPWRLHCLLGGSYCCCDCEDLVMRTPTPWGLWAADVRAASQGLPRAKLIGPPSIYHDRGEFFTPEDAAHIVNAVNAYDRLIAFLKSERAGEIGEGYPPPDWDRVQRIDDLLRELGE